MRRIEIPQTALHSSRPHTILVANGSGTAKAVTLHYLKRANPYFLLQKIQGIQTGALPRTALDGVVSDAVLANMLKVNWPAATKWLNTKTNASAIQSTRLEASDLTRLAIMAPPQPADAVPQLMKFTWAAAADLAHKVATIPGVSTFTPVIAHSPRHLDFGDVPTTAISYASEILTPSASTSVALAIEDDTSGVFTIDGVVEYGRFMGIVDYASPTDWPPDDTGHYLLPADTEENIRVKFNPGTRPIGEYRATLVIRAEGYGDIRVPLRANVTDIELVVVPTTDKLECFQGGMPFFHVHAIGLPATKVRLEAVDIPTGFTIPPVTMFATETGSSGAIVIGVADTVRPSPYNLTFHYSGQDGRIEGRFNLLLGVVDQHWEFSISDMNTGKVQSRDFRVTIDSDGTASWHCQLEDSSNIYGDKYLLTWHFNGSRHGGESSGRLDVGEKRYADGQVYPGSVSVEAEWYRTYWRQAATSGISAQLRSSGDLWGALGGDATTIIDDFGPHGASGPGGGGEGPDGPDGSRPGDPLDPGPFY
jgi:hypothetical protein